MIINKHKIFSFLIFTFLMFHITFFYPFILRYLNFSIYQGLFIFFVFTIFIFFFSIYIFYPQKTDLRIPLFFKIKNPFLTISIIFYFLYELILIFSNLYQFTNASIENYSLKPLFIEIIKFLISFLLLFYVETKYLIRFINFYFYFIYLLSISGILMTVLIAIDIMHPLFTITIDTHGFIDTGERKFYGLGFGWMNICFQGFCAPRLQSIAAEAGNFAFPIIIAILWGHIVKRKRFTFLLPLYIALFLTLSIGAWITILFAYLLLLIKNLLNFKTSFYKKFFFYMFVLSISVILFIYKYWEEIQYLIVPLKMYLETKFSSSASQIGYSSAEERFDAIKTIFEYYTNGHLIGLGSDCFKILDISLAVGWVKSLLTTGFIGWTFYLFSFFILFILALYKVFFTKRVKNEKDKIILFSSLTLIVLTIMAMQRTPIDGTPWNMVFLILFVKSFNNKIGG